MPQLDTKIIVELHQISFKARFPCELHVLAKQDRQERTVLDSIKISKFQGSSDSPLIEFGENKARAELRLQNFATFKLIVNLSSSCGVVKIAQFDTAVQEVSEKKSLHLTNYFVDCPDKESFISYSLYLIQGSESRHGLSFSPTPRETHGTNVESSSEMQLRKVTRVNSPENEGVNSAVLRVTQFQSSCQLPIQKQKKFSGHTNFPKIRENSPSSQNVYRYSSLQRAQEFLKRFRNQSITCIPMSTEFKLYNNIKDPYLRSHQKYQSKSLYKYQEIPNSDFNRNQASKRNVNFSHLKNTLPLNDTKNQRIYELKEQKQVLKLSYEKLYSDYGRLKKNLQKVQECKFIVEAKVQKLRSENRNLKRELQLQNQQNKNQVYELNKKLNALKKQYSRCEVLSRKRQQQDFAKLTTELNSKFEIAKKNYEGVVKELKQKVEMIPLMENIKQETIFQLKDSLIDEQEKTQKALSKLQLIENQLKDTLTHQLIRQQQVEKQIEHLKTENLQDSQKYQQQLKLLDLSYQQQLGSCRSELQEIKQVLQNSRKQFESLSAENQNLSQTLQKTMLINQQIRKQNVRAKQELSQTTEMLSVYIVEVKDLQNRVQTLKFEKEHIEVEKAKRYQEIQAEKNINFNLLQLQEIDRLKKENKKLKSMARGNASNSTVETQSQY